MWTEPSDLLVPHRATVTQGLWISDGEAEEDDIRPSIGESSILLMITKSVPET